MKNKAALLMAPLPLLALAACWGDKKDKDPAATGQAQPGAFDDSANNMSGTTPTPPPSPTPGGGSTNSSGGSAKNLGDGG